MLLLHIMSLLTLLLFIAFIAFLFFAAQHNLDGASWSLLATFMLPVVICFLNGFRYDDYK